MKPPETNAESKLQARWSRFPLPRLSQQAAILLAIPLLFQLVFVAILGYQMNEAEEEAWHEMRAKSIVTEASELMRMVENSAVGLYKSAISEQKFSDKFARTSDQMRREIYLLRVLVGNNEEQRDVVDATEDGIQKAWQLVLSFEDATNRGEDVNHGAMLSQFRSRLMKVSKNLFGVVQRLNSLAAKSTEDPLRAAQSRLNVQYVLLGGLGFDILLALTLAILFNRLTALRLSTLLDNTNRLAQGEILIPQLQGQDEMAELDRRFHEMAAAMTEAKRKELAVINNAVDVICSIDSELRFSRLNPAAEEMFGRPTSELVGTNITEHIFVDDTKSSLIVLGETRTTGSVKSFESRLIRADKSVADALWSVHWSQPDQSFFCVLHDITNRKEVERLKQEFVQMISHDLRTPLMSVQTDLNLLEAGVVDPVSEKVQKRLAGADKNISYVIDLINSLLDIERLNAGEQQLQFSEFPLNDLLSRSIDTVKPLADRANVALELVAEQMRIEADEPRLMQVVINLVSNAVKFSSSGGSVLVSSRYEGSDCVISVTDRGRGIPASKLATVFERFRQVEESDSTVKGGSGLGLAICKAIVEQHSGKISVVSEPGLGTTFTLKIPARRA